jgi:hypothetical protein
VCVYVNARVTWSSATPSVIAIFRPVNFPIGYRDRAQFTRLRNALAKLARAAGAVVFHKLRYVCSRIVQESNTTIINSTSSIRKFNYI